MSERAMEALHALADFDVAEAASIVARLAKTRQHAQHLVNVLTTRCAAAALEIREMMQRERVNPTLLDAVQRLYRAEQAALRQWRSSLAGAEQREQQASMELARLRNRERSLQRAVNIERRKLSMKRDARDMTAAEDLWLLQAATRSVQ